MKRYEDYWFSLKGCECCSHVNRGEYKIETLGVIRDGEILAARCSLCGGGVKVTSEDIASNGKLNIGIVINDEESDKVAEFVFEGNIYRGYPMGEKRRV